MKHLYLCIHDTREFTLSVFTCFSIIHVISMVGIRFVSFHYHFPISFRDIKTYRKPYITRHFFSTFDFDRIIYVLPDYYFYYFLKAHRFISLYRLALRKSLSFRKLFLSRLIIKHMWPKYLCWFFFFFF